MTGGVKEGWAWVSDRPFWLLGWALSLCVRGRRSTDAVVVQARPWRGRGRSCRGQGTEGEEGGALTGSTRSTGCQIGGHEKSRPDSKCKTVWP